MKNIGLNIACVCGVSHRNWYLQDYYTLMFHFSAKDELVIHTLNTISSKSVFEPYPSRCSKITLSFIVIV